MNAPAQVEATPRRMRRAALLVMVVASIVGIVSAWEAWSLGSLDEARSRTRESAPKLTPLLDPEVLVVVTDAQISALQSMKTSRAFILAGLSLVCAMAFVSAGRLARPESFPREAVRRTLAGSLITAAFLRTADGAQSSVVAGHAANALAAAQSALSADGASPMPQVPPELIIGFFVVHTAVVAGTFLLLGQYFRSEKVKQVVALQDQQVER